MSFPIAATTAASAASNGATHSRNAAPHRKNAAQQSRSDSPYQQRTTKRDNPPQLLIKQAVDYLIQQLEAGKSETLTAYLNAMARFHSYSFGNILQIARQRPTASRVAGIRAWNEMGRFVKKGEKGIRILAPMIGFRRRNAEAARTSDADSSTKQPPVLIGFRAVYVFDVAQTEGEDLPEFEHNISGEVGEQRDRLRDFLAQQNIALEFNERIAPALGVSYGGKIALLPGQSKPEEFVTLVHETAHELLHKAERRTFTTATVRETEAEAVAFIVGQAIGLEMGNASSDYIRMYNGNATLLAESLEVIQRTSAVILAAIRDDESAEPATEPEQVAAAS
ncbi:MAG TPA: ArdC family protein [Edaphobacter sp.]|uniref:ArdC family protein n=1 Tax=Edaphobacter sp. TaxID=1934404 RepID=UPI002D0FDD9F|nr:ArdC family protein [Edaphobacter sp.]HUZ96488.1 ArdC family protein [Edaphobacter sp.]